MKIKTNFKIMIALGIMLLLALVLNINTVKATVINESDVLIKDNLVDGIIAQFRYFDVPEGKTGNDLWVGISTEKLYTLLNDTNLLKQKVKEDGYVYEYFYIKLPNNVNSATITKGKKGATEEKAEIVTINNEKYIKCYFTIAHLIDNEFYEGFVGGGEISSYNVKFKSNNDIISKARYVVEIDYYNNNFWSGFDLELQSDIKDKYMLGGQGDPGYVQCSYNRKVANGNCYIVFYASKNVGDSVYIKPFGKLDYVGISNSKDEFHNGKYEYKAKITDKSIFNKDIVRFEYLTKNILLESFWNFSGDLIEIEAQDIETTDTTTNIKLDTTTDVVPTNTILVAEEIKEEATIKAVKESLENVAEKFVTYDITLTSNGVAIQPNGKVKISIPVPTDYDKTKLAVYRVDVDGAKTEYKTTVEGDYATIETDHFSTYVLAEKTTKVAEATNNTETTTTTTDTSKELDETPKTGTIDIINYVIALTVLAGVGIVAIKKMK